MSAFFSANRTHRYALTRDIEPKAAGYAMFIGLNPSTADETNDDPTIRRCINFAKSWGYGRLVMTNLFSLRATDPRVMKACAAPSDKANDDQLLISAANAGIIIAAWGVHGVHLNRELQVRQLMYAAGVTLHCLGLTKGGHPKHPLYLRAETEPVVFCAIDATMEGNNG